MAMRRAAKIHARGVRSDRRCVLFISPLPIVACFRNVHTRIMLSAATSCLLRSVPRIHIHIHTLRRCRPIHTHTLCRERSAISRHPDSTQVASTPRRVLDYAHACIGISGLQRAHRADASCHVLVLNLFAPFGLHRDTRASADPSSPPSTELSTTSRANIYIAISHQTRISRSAFWPARSLVSILTGATGEASFF